MDPCPDESCSPQIPRQPSVQERKDSFSYSWHQGELQEQPNHAIAKLLLTHWEFWICFHIKFGYQYTCPLPAHLSFFRHVELLLNSIKKMDVQYDECNTAMAQGEVNGFDMKLPSWKKNMLNVYCYIVQFSLVGPATEFFMRHWFLQLRNITAMEFLDVFPYRSGYFCWSQIRIWCHCEDEDGHLCVLT